MLLGLKLQDQQRHLPGSEPRSTSDRCLCPAQGENLSRTLSQIAAFLWDPETQTLLATEGVDPAATNTQMPECIKARITAQPLEAAERERRWWLPGSPRRAPAGPQCPHHQHSKQATGPFPHQVEAPWINLGIGAGESLPANPLGSHVPEPPVACGQNLVGFES